MWSDIDLLRAWLGPEAAIQLIYAATEAPMMQWFVDDSCRADDARIPIGYPLPGNRLALLDEFGRNTPPGEVGELIVASPYVALGLWVDGRCAAGGIRKQRRCPLVDFSGREISCAKGPTGCWSGSAARTGRSRFGAPASISMAWKPSFVSTPWCAMSPPWRDLRSNRRADGEVNLVAYVSLCDGAPPGMLDDLKELMRSAPPPMRPGRLYLADKIPRLPSSKLDLRALMALDEVNIQNERANVAAAAEAGPADGDSHRADGGSSLARSIASARCAARRTTSSTPAAIR